MEIREVKHEDIISLLHCAADDKDCVIFDSWGAYQKWLINACYTKGWQVLVADDGFGVVGFIVGQLYHTYDKWVAHLHYLYVVPDFRKTGVGISLVKKLVDIAMSSTAQRFKFDTRVLPQEWLDSFLPNAPLSKSNTYYADLRSEETKRYYDENFNKSSL